MKKEEVMKFLLKILIRLNVLILAVVMLFGNYPGFTATEIEYETAYGNPMKGFIPFYSEDGADESVPYSMEWFYVPMSALVDDSGEYKIREGLEPYLEKISSRGHQAVFRIFLDYPNAEIGEKAVPQFIWDMGVKKYPYDEYGGGVSPDYSDQRLIDFLVEFVGKLADEYDGDGRIAYITTGLIGHWGEWHVCTSIKQAMASDKQKKQVIRAFERSFKQTKILTRYPGTPGTGNGKIGFHDDSFTFETLNDSKNYYFYTKMKKSLQTGVWKSQAIGGEFRPEGQENFLKNAVTDDYQPFDECVKKTHCSWLMMQTAFNGGLSQDEINVAKNASASLGYDFTVTSVTVRKFFGKAYIRVGVKNTGVAPIYADPAVYIGTEASEKKTGQHISTLMPGKTEYFTAVVDLKNGDEIYIRIDSLFDGGHAVRLSNTGAKDRFIIGKVN